MRGQRHGGVLCRRITCLWHTAQCANAERLTLADPRTAAWLRGEAIPAETAAPGWAAVLADGFPLGFGKQSGGVVKNHYPKGLRNLK
ncbi:MAG: methyltransferase RsmF C-terminal domain-like protein [Ruthenibacterium lactatiformans]